MEFDVEFEFFGCGIEFEFELELEFEVGTIAGGRFAGGITVESMKARALVFKLVSVVLIAGHVLVDVLGLQSSIQ